MNRNMWKRGCASLAAAALMAQPGVILAQDATVTIAPKSSDAVAQYTLPAEAEARLTQEQKLELLRKHIEYVFVLFQENRSFDYYFATYPGANGLYSQPAAQTPGFVQPIVNTDGTVSTISPFRIPLTVTNANGQTVPLYPADTDSVNHSHVAFAAKLDVQNGVTLNDRYAVTEEGLTLTNGVPSAAPTEQQKQMGELVMSHVDCNTAPLLWNFADRFTLFDDFHQTVVGPSTPNAIAMIAGQTGETQWVRHPQDSTKAYGSAGGIGVPVITDNDPFWGSQLDLTGYGVNQPANPPSASPEINLTFASLPLSFMGSKIYKTTAQDTEPQTDLTDIDQDINEIAGEGVKPTNWGWYQQGYDHEANDLTAAASHTGYITHHNGPQYFGYVSNNPTVSTHLHGLTDFANAMRSQSLPADGGVFYVRGGYGNLSDHGPVDPNPALATVFNGNDDHPGYSDVQISEGLVAQEVNLIASSPYWKDSAIIITYDETDGLYDHAPSVIRSHDSEGLPLDQGPRIPAIVISPYSRVHAISHAKSEHSSVIKFINEIFGLEPLADLPDEAQARKLGETELGQSTLGPADDHIPGVSNLFSAFDNNRLMGTEAPLPATYAETSLSAITNFPQLNNEGCRILNITPTDNGMPNPVPADFNPRPSSTPGIPTSASWTP